MPRADIDGIDTNYEVRGSGPAVLMLSPGGFNASLSNWTSLGVYSRLRLVTELSRRFTCVTFDRREAGASGGRLERVRWSDYANQARGLLEHLEIGRAHILGGCAGCSVAAAFAVEFPSWTGRCVFFWPAGGAKYRMRQLARFGRHLAFAQEKGLGAVAAYVKGSDGSFADDPRVGPWATVIRQDETFANTYAAFDPSQYSVMVAGMARTLFDRDTVPAVEPEDLMGSTVPALVIPGHDDSHATSAARYLEECLPLAQYWDIAVDQQTEHNVPERIAEFLATP